MKWLLLLLLMGVRPAWSQEEVKTPLPDSLTRGAGMVKRMDLTEIAIESPRKARLHRKYIYTILNHSGDAYSSISTWYDKFHDLDNVSAVLYDAQGHVVKKLKKNDLEDWNVEGAGMLMVDSRVKFYQ